MIGILKGNVGNKDRDFFAMYNLNKLSKTDTPCCLFCDYIDPNFVLPVDVNVLQRNHIFNFDGITITDDLALSQDFLYATYNHKRFLYLYHLEWPYINGLHFSHLKKVLLNDNIHLIARSDTHATVIEQLFKKPKYFMPEWDYGILREIDNNE